MSTNSITLAYVICGLFVYRSATAGEIFRLQPYLALNLGATLFSFLLPRQSGRRVLVKIRGPDREDSHLPFFLTRTLGQHVEPGW